MGTLVATATSAIVASCAPTYVMFEHGPDWIIAEKRDFRFSVGAGALTPEQRKDPEAALRLWVAEEVRKAGICPNGFSITKFGGYEVGSGYFVEGICLHTAK
jgi:hypothetical protein